VAREFSRASRIAEQIQRDLSEVIRVELKDPRVRLVTITAVDVSRDLSHAKVYVTSLGEADAAEQTVSTLQHAAGFLRSQLARTLKARMLPQLQFIYDASVERGIRLSQLIDQAVADSEDHSDEIESSDDK
jgi:ribosome-binding factor A